MGNSVRIGKAGQQRATGSFLPGQNDKAKTKLEKALILKIQRDLKENDQISKIGQSS